MADVLSPSIAENRDQRAHLNQSPECPVQHHQVIAIAKLDTERCEGFHYDDYDS
jgi:hypothetical protein